MLLGATAAGSHVGALPRATTDRPDELSGAQVHVIYAVPSDGADRALDTDGTLAASVSNFQAWLRGQTGGRALRLDTFEGQPDISFTRLPKTDAQIAATGAFVRDTVEHDLIAMGFNSPTKLLAVYYDGTSTSACGGGAYPPTLPGTAGMLYLGARSAPASSVTSRSGRGAGSRSWIWRSCTRFCTRSGSCRPAHHTTPGAATSPTAQPT